MSWLSFLAAFVRLAGEIAGWLRARALLAAGATQGRAASDAAHARAAAELEARMRKIAATPPPRAEIERRLDEGSG